MSHADKGDGSDLCGGPATVYEKRQGSNRRQLRRYTVVGAGAVVVAALLCDVMRFLG